ncbi:right-handed parallel beta-helix repeat-containing protein [Spiractinospora alimapuensis]|uniref:right-handed parallel beta-helix repeat-containing protein n=1 Tax=Spiractinospora alimapuensis TaxID=2820884 RepID=UPI001F407066|nr:right-handed parallel beta-helix repeat-containing protein [Spiractinospora alimapuensis]QVQ52817.1 right-handed parallel beta-helix repeat-containing protein [Spiractinospora alimapuensis]
MPNEFHVAPGGDDTGPGSHDQPFATPERAQRAARDPTRPAVVTLAPGTYPLTEPLVVTEADSGLSFRAEDGPAVLSGGREVTGWRELDGVWEAEVGDLDCRELYVDGRRAERATIDALPGDARRTERGYVTDSAAPLSWHDPSSVEFVHRGVYPWTEARSRVASVTREGDTTTITMEQPEFDRAKELYNFAWDGYQGSGLDLPTRIENDPAFLTEPGTFALDRSHSGQHLLHYRPHPGEDPRRTRVVAPSLDTLVRISGASAITLTGLVLAEATWPRQRSFLHYHGTGYYDGEGDIETAVIEEDVAWVTYPSRARDVPACVTVDDSEDVRFEDCHFTRIGATALGVTGGAGLLVRGCDFDTLSASAIRITGGRAPVVEDNRVTRIGRDYPGSPALGVTGTTDAVIAHNDVDDVPHCGIVAGPARGTRITHNHVTRSMGVLADGGGVYLSGPQGDSWDTGAVIEGNVITDTRTPYNFGLYTDYGAAWVTLRDNVVLRADNTAVLHVSPPLDHVSYRGNLWDADPVGSDAVPEGVTFADNTTVDDDQEPPRRFAEITAAAGPRHPRGLAETTPI